MVRRLILVLAAVLGLTAAGCSGCGEGAAGAAAGDGTERLDAFGDLRTELDLLDIAHLADVDHGGTFIDFGTPARWKYTVGQWRTGFVADRRDGELTYSYVEETGRVFFNVDNPGPLTLRIRAKSVGSRNMSLFLNGHQQELVRLAEGDTFADYDVHITADHVERGENYLLMRFGGSTQVDGHDVAAALESMRIVEGDTMPPGDYAAPLWGSYVAEMEIDGTRRRALTLERSTTVSYFVQIPRGGSLGFGVGAEGESPAPAPVEVWITPEGAERTRLFEGSAEGEWHDEVLSLERWQGRVARIDFVVKGQGRGRVGWGAPTLLVPPPEEERRLEPAKNVVVLVVDTLRADKLRPFNPRSRVNTPVLDAMAGQSVLFEQAHAPENWTKPSVASVLTGLFPATHGAKSTEARLPDGALLISEHVRAQGFATAGFIANGYVSDRFGFDQGWDHYTNYIRESRNTEAENVFGEAATWIEAHRDGRFFVYIQTIDPHVPYDPPDEYVRMYDRRDYAGQVQPRQTHDLLERAKRTPPAVTFDASDQRRLTALHDGEISYHDHSLGQFIERLRQLGVWEDTLFVMTADHGEEFNDHGSWGHGHTVFEELLHVPLLFHMPGNIPTGMRVSDTVSTVDVAGTVVALAGLPAMPNDEGVDLTTYMTGARPAVPSVAFSDFLDDRRVITAGRWKLMLRGINGTLFDLETDPGEQREVDRNDHPIAMRFCRIMLGQFLGSTDRSRWLSSEQGTGVTFTSESAPMDDTIRQQLQALGYAN